MLRECICMDYMILINFFSKDTLIISPSISLRQWKGFGLRKPKGMSNIIPLTDFTLKIFQGLRLWDVVSLLWWPFRTHWHETHLFRYCRGLCFEYTYKKWMHRTIFFFGGGKKKETCFAHTWYKKNLLEIKNN